MDNTDHTRIIHRPSGSPPPPPPPLPTMLDPEKTRIVDRGNQGGSPGGSPQHMQADDDKTVVLVPSSRSRTPGSSEVPVRDAMSDPVVGWLVIVAGPGKGNFVRLGYGMNNVGRAEDQRCRMDFGDTEISRKAHANVTYDPRGRKFYLLHGGGQNLTYLSGMPVLVPTALTGGELISIGKTTLKFVPLCGSDFDWADVDES